MYGVSSAALCYEYSQMPEIYDGRDTTHTRGCGSNEAKKSAKRYGTSRHTMRRADFP